MNWKNARLVEVTSILGGTTPKSENSTFWNGNHIWVTPTDLGKLDTRVITDSARRITDAGLDSCGLPLVPAGAIVMSSRAPIGHLAIAGCDLHTNQGCKSFVCGEYLDSEFLFFTLQYRMADIQTLGSGATFVEVSKSALENFEIVFPDIQDQRTIAKKLTIQLAAVEEARQAAQTQLSEIRQLKTRVLNEVFASIEGTCPLGKVARIQSGYAFKSESFKKEGVRLLRNANILPGKVYWTNSVFIASDDAGNYPAYSLNAGDVLISLDRPIISTGIKVARVMPSDLPALLVQRVGRFQIDKNRLNPDYLFAFLQTQAFIDTISGHEQSLGVPHISPGQIEAVEIPLPDIETQKRLAVVLTEIAQSAHDAQAAAEAQLQDIELLPSRLLAQVFDAPD